MSSNKKISDLADGGALQATDEIEVARAGNNFKVAGSEFGGSQTQTATVTTDPNTFTAQHVFDLGGVAAMYVKETITALVPDGETFGSSLGDITVAVTGGPALSQRSRDGVTYYDAAGESLGGLLDMDTVGQYREFVIVTPRYLRVNLVIEDPDSGLIYSGSNHPTATVRYDLEAAT